MKKIGWLLGVMWLMSSIVMISKVSAAVDEPYTVNLQTFTAQSTLTFSIRVEEEMKSNKNYFRIYKITTSGEKLVKEVQIKLGDYTLQELNGKLYVVLHSRDDGNTYVYDENGKQIKKYFVGKTYSVGELNYHSEFVGYYSTSGTSKLYYNFLTAAQVKNPEVKKSNGYLTVNRGSQVGEIELVSNYADPNPKSSFRFKSEFLYSVLNTRFQSKEHFKIGSRYLLTHSTPRQLVVTLVDRSGEVIADYMIEDMSYQGVSYYDANRIVLQTGNSNYNYFVEISIHTGEHRILGKYDTSRSGFKTIYQVSPNHYIRFSFGSDNGVNTVIDLHQIDGKFIRSYSVPVKWLQGFKVLQDGYISLHYMTDSDSYEILVNAITGYVYPHTKSQFYNLASEEYIIVTDHKTSKTKLMFLPKNNATIPFKDVSRTHYAKDAINWAISRGFVNGYTDKTFKPNASLTEAEFVKMLATFVQLEKSNQVLENVEGAQNHWSNAYYNQLAAYGIPLKGYFDIAKRNQPLTRGAMAQILGSVYSSDATLKESIQFLIKNGITNGLRPSFEKTDINQFFGSYDGLTRAQAVLFLQRLDASSYRSPSAKAIEKKTSFEGLSLQEAAETGMELIDPSLLP
jgi:hypothetical protein